MKTKGACLIQMKRLIIGVTGPTGAGKSSLRLCFESRGFTVIDSDRAARDITEPGSPVLDELAEAFGSDIIGRDGVLDRAKLAHRAFASPEKTALLNSITHPRITQIVWQRVCDAHALGMHAAVEAPLLIEAGMNKWCDFVVAVLAPEEQRLRRIMLRDRLSEHAARERIAAQQPDDFYRDWANFVIYNDLDSITLEKMGGRMLDELLERFGYAD